MIRSRKIRESARGEDCTMNSPRCNYDPATSSWCHSNFQEHGKGVGHKAHDIMGFIGCSGCHYWFDIESRRGVSKPERALAFYRAWAKSIIRLFEKGVIKIA